MNLYENLLNESCANYHSAISSLKYYVQQANDAIDTGNTDNIITFEERISRLLKDVNDANEDANIYTILNMSTDSVDAMRRFTTLLYYPVCTIAKNETGRIEIVEPTDEFAQKKLFDIKKAFKLSVSGIGNNKDWINHAAALRAVMTAALCADVEILGVNDIEPADPDMSYWDLSAATRVVEYVFNTAKVPKKAWQYIDDSGNNLVPLSKSRQKAMLTAVVRDMIGDNAKVKSYDFKWLHNAFAQFNSKSGLKCANQQKFIQLLMFVCHSALTNEPYDVTYKTRDLSKPNPRYQR